MMKKIKKLRAIKVLHRFLIAIKRFFVKVYKVKAIKAILVTFLILNILASICINIFVVYMMSFGDTINNQVAQCPADGIAKAMDSVVLVKGANGSGSGFWVRDNIIVTNNHVVVDNGNLVVSNANGLNAKAKVIETDTMKDLAVLEIEGAKGTPLEWRIGDTYVAEDTYALGYPLSKDLTITKGIISAITYDDYDSRVYIQTDSAINLGNSGGPLLDKCGKVLGVNTSTISDTQNIGFSLKFDQASKSVDDMLLASAKSSNEEKKNSYPSEQAEVIAKYYTTLSMGKLPEAYSFYSKKRQTRYPLESWTNQMATSGFITLKTVENTDQANTIKVDFLATDYTEDYYLQTKEFVGTWTLVRENNMWKMDESNIADLGLK